jgi:PAS domain S-box-containing protein
MSEREAHELPLLLQGPGVRSVSQAEVLRLLHELEVHQAEVSLQDEALRRTQAELEEAHQRYFELYELAPVGYATLDFEGRVLVANLTLAGLFGIQRRDLVGERFVGRLSPESRRRFAAFIAKMMREDGPPATLEVLLRRGSSHLPALLTVAGVARDRSVGIAVTDLTHLRGAQESVRDHEARLQAVFDTVADGIVTVDERGRIETCNAAAARIFGTSQLWLVGRAVGLVMPGFSRLVDKGRAELVAHRVDGTKVPVEVAVSKLKGGTRDSRPPANHVVTAHEPLLGARLVGVITDISERKRREEELDESLARFRQMAEHLDDAIYVVEADTGKTLYASPALERIFGRSALEVHAERWPRLAWVDEEDRERVKVAADRLREGKGPFDVQYRAVRPDGSLRTLRSRSFLIPEHNRVTGIVHDMTEELSLQAELRQAQRLEAIGTLASGVAHDFNNLLMGVGGCVQLALRRLDPQHDAHGYIRRAGDAILRGASLTRQILRFSDTRSTTDEPVELDGVVSGARALVQSLVGEHIALSVITGAPELLIAADPGDLEQVLLNLASNARDAMPDGGSLTLRTEPFQGGLVALSVRDTGVGMGEDTKRRVFEPFFTTKEVGKGTGLGLSTVFAVVRRMGGSIDINSAPGQGTTFTLYLPVVIPDPGVKAAERVASAQGQGQTILVVDDDPLVRMTVETHVESLGYRALTASSVTDALKVFTQSPRPIDVVLTDIMMPGLLGSDLNRILQKSAPDVAVIFMSAHPWQDLTRQGHLRENARLLTKPFDAQDLGLALHQALKDKPPRTQPARLRIFVVDDDQDVVDALRDLLQMEGHEVSAALSTAEALEKIPEFSPDVVLCDLNVDETMSGLEVASRLHRLECLKHTVFLAVTGVAPHQSRPAALAAGFHDVLVKPLDFNQLSAFLASRLRR